MALKPKLLVLDEPTEGIQSSIINDISQVIRMRADRVNYAKLKISYQGIAKLSPYICRVLTDEST